MKKSLILVSSLFAAAGLAWAGDAGADTRATAVVEREQANAREAWNESSDDAGTESGTREGADGDKNVAAPTSDEEEESWWEWFLRERHVKPNVGRWTERFAGTGERTRVVLADVEKSGEETIEKREEKFVDEGISNGDKSVADPESNDGNASSAGTDLAGTDSAGTQILRSVFSAGTGTVFSLDVITATNLTMIADDSLVFATNGQSENDGVTSMGNSKEYSTITVNADVAGTLNLQINNTRMTIGAISFGNEDSELEIIDHICDFLEIDNLYGAGTLVRSRTNGNAWGSGTVIGATDSDLTTAFTGTVKMVNGASSYSQVLFVENESILQSATLNLGNYSTLALDLTNTKIGGLESAENATLGIVISYAKPDTYTASSTSNNVFNSQTAYNASDTTARTLELTGTGNYSYSGAIGDSTNTTSVNLAKTGAGTQVLAGTNYLGNLTISAGTLEIAGTTNVTGTASAMTAGTLALADGILNVTGTSTTFTSGVPAGFSFVVSGGEIVSTGDSTIALATTATGYYSGISMTAGTLKVDSGTLTIAAESVANGDTLCPISITGTATTEIADGATLYLDSKLTNSTGGVNIWFYLNASGSTGTIVADTTGNYHNTHLDVGENFTGTLRWIGNWNPANLTNLAAGATLILQQKTSSSYAWSGSAPTINAKTILDGDYGFGAGVTYTFANGLSGTNSGTAKFVANNTKIEVSGGELRDIAISAGNYTGTALNITGTVKLAGTVDLTDESTVAVTSTGNLTIAGTLKLSGTAIQNAGTVSVSPALALIDISNLTAVCDQDNEESRSYTLISGGTISNWANLTAANIDFGHTLSSRETVDFSTPGVVTVIGVALDLIWAGTASANSWNNDETNLVWTEDGTTTKTYFETGDNVTFDSTAANKNVVIAENIEAGTLLIYEDVYTFSNLNDAQISAGTAQIHYGATLILQSANIFSDSTIIENNGVLQTNGFWPEHQIVGAGELHLIANAGTQNLTTENIISGATKLVVDAGTAGIYTISAAQDFTGGTQILSGTLAFSTDDALGSGTIELAAGTLQNAGTSAGTLANAIDITGAGTIDTGTQNLTLSGNIVGEAAATLTKIGAGTLELSGTANIAGTLYLNEGDLLSTVTLAHSTHIANLVIADGLTATFSDTNPTPSTALGTVTLGQDAQLIHEAPKIQAGGNFKDYGEISVENIVLAGTHATVSAGTSAYAGLWKIEGLVGGNETQKVSLDLVSNVSTAEGTGMYAAEFGFTGTQTESLFYGILNLQQLATTSNRFAAVIISND